MSAYTQLPKDHPVMIAWAAFKADAEFENTKRWAMRPEGVLGSLWAVFYAGRQSLEAENKSLSVELSACKVFEGTFKNHRDELLEELNALREENDRLRAAARAVIDAEEDFISHMHPDWEKDPVSEAVDALRAAMDAQP